MTADDNRAQEKRQELVELATQTLARFSPSISDVCFLAERLVDHFIDITAPEVPTYVDGFVSMHTFRNGTPDFSRASSTKPGNIVLNMRKLITALASGVLTVAGAVAIHGRRPLLLWCCGIASGPACS